MDIDSVGIVGGGAWGTALAQAMRHAGRDVVLWAREADVVGSINERHVNETFLPGVTLDADIRATGKLADVATCDALLMVAPAQHVRAVAKALRPSLRRGQPVVICAKGIEQASGKMMGDVVEAELPEATLAALSGPELRRRRGARFADRADHRLRRRDGGPRCSPSAWAARSSGFTGRATSSASSSAAR